MDCHPERSARHDFSGLAPRDEAAAESKDRSCEADIAVLRLRDRAITPPSANSALVRLIARGRYAQDDTS